MHLKSTAECRITTSIFEKKLWRGVSINIPLKIYQGQQNYCRLWDWIKGITRVLNWLKCLDVIMHIKPTVGCQISILIFEKKTLEWGSLLISHKIYIKYGTVLAHFGIQLKVLLGIIIDRSPKVGKCTSSPRQGFKYQLWYLKKKLWRGLSINTHEKYIKNGKVLAHFWLS